MTDGVEDLVVDIYLNTVESFLSVDGRIVSIETGVVELLLLAAPTVRPDHRFVVVADGDDRIYQRMNMQLQYGRAVTSFRRARIMRVRARSRRGLALEINRVAFENRLADDAVIGFVDGQDEGNDAVTTIRCAQRVAVDTLLVIGVTLELVA